MSDHWGLKLRDRLFIKKEEEIPLQEILINTIVLFKGVSDCSLCGLPLQNEVLIKDGGLWTFKCGHNFHGACLDLNKIKLCPSCSH